MKERRYDVNEGHLDDMADALKEAAEGIALIDDGMKYVFCNRAWVDFFGMDPGTDYRGLDIDLIQNEHIKPVYLAASEGTARSGRYDSDFFAPWCGKTMSFSADLIRAGKKKMVLVMMREAGTPGQPGEKPEQYRDNIDNAIRDRERGLKRSGKLREELDAGSRSDIDKMDVSEERFRAQFRAAPMPIYIWKENGDDLVLTDYNDEAIKFTSGAVKKIEGLGVSQIYADSPEILEDFNKCRSEKKSILREMFYSSKVSDKSWFASIKYVFVPPDIVMVFAEDITDRVEASRRLKEQQALLEEQVRERTREIEESEIRYRAVSELTSDFSYVGTVYPDGSVEKNWVTGMYHEMTGFGRDEILEREEILSLVHPDDMWCVKKHVDAYLRGEMMVTEFRIRRKDGETRWVLCSGKPMGTDEKGGVRILGAVKDITSRKILETKLEHRNRELRTLNRLQAIFRSSRNQKVLMDKLLEALFEERDVPAAAVYVPDDKEKTLVCAAYRGVDRELIDSVGPLSMDDPAIRNLMEAKGTLVTPDSLPDPGPAFSAAREKAGIGKTIVMPVEAGGQIEALFIMGFSRKTEMTQEKKDFFTIVASQLCLEFERLRLVDEQKRSQKELKKLTGNLIESMEQERRHLALNLHDDIGQSIVALKRDFERVESIIDTEDPEWAEWLDGVRKRFGDLTDTIRKSAYSLHPAMLEDLGLIPTLETYLDNFVKVRGIEVNFETAGFDAGIPSPLALTLYRVAQEALSNVVRHSGARKINLMLTKGYPNVIMIVEDDGRGFLPRDQRSRGKGLGLISMRERVAMANGRLKIGSSPGKGTRVRVELPLEVSDDRE